MQVESITPEPPYSIDFYDDCAGLVTRGFNIDLHRDINVENCIDVYFLSSREHFLILSVRLIYFEPPE